MLVLVAVVLGAFLLARGFDDDAGSSQDTSGEESAEPAGSGSQAQPEVTATTVAGAPATTTTSTTVAPPPVVTRPAGEVKVAVMNGTGVRGRAGRTADKLNAGGYVTAAKNTQQDRVENSVVYYRQGYGDDAKAVASALGAAADIITPAPATIMTLIRNPESPADLVDFHVFVVLGTDDTILDPTPPAAG
ncbi:MAG: LytR C-terminal domain-containing protein [Acidimicrobiaceae bacterium]|nr:LytR C-terminal domain-containing protein [Acidimicrobiaceae bacterium]MCY4281170.1 LytR C-terminal domain-containing protein [Acidimicrobiaceae bacterium]MCY4294395.1 LytR C-terminal domain-containing protein [Acidimicrobiaceae bacterium]